MAGLRSDIEAMWVVFNEAVIRFWNNRFHKSDEVSYLRIELAKRDEEIKRLTNLLIYFNNDEGEEELPQTRTEPQPFNGYTPFHIVRAQAERESFERAKRLAGEAKSEIEKEKSTEDLEKELLG